jgi:hypothetical protein
MIPFLNMFEPAPEHILGHYTGLARFCPPVAELKERPDSRKV